MFISNGNAEKIQNRKIQKATPASLRFNENGKFRILHLTDIHQVMPEMDDEEDKCIPAANDIETQNVIETLIEETKPDLVVFGGDNVSGYWKEFDYELIRKTIQKITYPIRKRNLPLCVVFGNHDAEEGFHLEFQMMMYHEYSDCRSSFNDADVYGCGNCCVTIKSSKSNKDAFALWLIDSNDYQ